MESEIKDSYLKAGKIAAMALDFGRRLIKKEKEVLDVLNKVDEKILSLGGGIAFPSQISLDSVAAHQCPSLGEVLELGGHVCKLDVGVHVDGYIGDNAVTVDLTGENEDLVLASRSALNNVLKKVNLGVTLGEIGKIVSEAIESVGFNPIANLSGHGLDRFVVHTKPTVPNIPNESTFQLKEGMVFACEPFASKGAGIVVENGESGVFSQVSARAVRDSNARDILDFISGYNGLPFAKRWIQEKFGVQKAERGLRMLSYYGILKGYPPLVDRADGLVSQAEHTVLMTDKGPIVTTKIDD